MTTMNNFGRVKSFENQPLEKCFKNKVAIVQKKNFVRLFELRLFENKVRLFEISFR